MDNETMYTPTPSSAIGISYEPEPEQFNSGRIVELSKMFDELNKMDLKGKTDDKMGLTYLNWAWAWTILKQKYPDARQRIYTHMVHLTTETITRAEGIETKTTSCRDEEVDYFTDGRTCYVKVGLILNGHEEVVTLPVMNMKNQSIRADMVTSVDVNRAKQRAFVKAAAMHGLGLYIYAGEKEPEPEPIVIDWTALTKKCNEIRSVPAEEMSNFNEHMTRVTQLIQQYGADYSDEIVKYVQTQVSTKISAITPDKFVELYRIEKFLLGIEEACQR